MSVNLTVSAENFLLKTLIAMTGADLGVVAQQLL
jgi:hypothetical protein